MQSEVDSRIEMEAYKAVCFGAALIPAFAGMTVTEALVTVLAIFR